MQSGLDVAVESATTVPQLAALGRTHDASLQHI